MLPLRRRRWPTLRRRSEKDSPLPKLLGLFRHAKSEWDDMTQRDFDRGLNARGLKGAKLVGRHIREHGTHWDMLLSSPAARCKDTLTEAALGLDSVWDERLYLADGATILETIAELGDDADAVLVCGHNPGLQDLLLELIPPDAENELFDEASVKFPTASFAVVELAIDDWSKLDDECGRIVHFTRPRDLDPELGPAKVG